VTLVEMTVKTTGLVETVGIFCTLTKIEILTIST
jgi:hypothetical protein